MAEEQTTAPEVQSEQTINQQPQDTSFIDTLPEDIRADASLQNFKDAGQLAKSYVHAQRMVGADKMPVPNKNFTEDDWKQTFSKLGVPETPDDYKVNYTLQEGADPQPVKNFVSHAHKLGMLPQQVQGILDYYGNLENQGNEEMQKQAELNKLNSEQELRKEFGLAYDKKINQANNVFGKFFVDDLKDVKLQDGSDILNHPGFIKSLAKLSDNFSEDNLGPDQTESSGFTPNEAQKEVSKIMGDQTHPYWLKDHPGHAAAVKEVANLQNMIHPNLEG